VIFVVKIKKEGATFIFPLQENNYLVVKLLTHWFCESCYGKVSLMLCYQVRCSDIIPLEITVPHDDVWVTVLTTEKERENYILFELLYIKFDLLALIFITNKS